MFSKLQIYQIMSSIIHKNAYQDFLNLLLEWQAEINSYDLEGEDFSSSRQQSLKSSTVWKSLKQAFQQKIITLTDKDLDLAAASRWISLQAEIQREFRLLETDWLFFLSSRQLGTKQTRYRSICDRLNKLIGYCRTMLEIG